MVKIELIACTGKTKEGKAFTYFKAVRKDGKLVRVHFRQVDGNNKPIIMPVASCIMEIAKEDVDYNTSKKYPELWVRGQGKYEDKPKATNANIEEIF